ncbi:MAG: hypothetical protein ACTSYB_17045 [Candidatus Helarchaeota archaeon]
MNKENSSFKNFLLISLLMNTIALLLYILSSFGVSALKTISTIFFFIVVAIDLTLIYVNLHLINRTNSTGQKIKMLNWIYLLFFLIAMLLLMSDSLIYSFIEVGNILRDISFIGAQLAYCGIFGLGIFTSYYDLQYIDQKNVWK